MVKTVVAIVLGIVTYIIMHSLLTYLIHKNFMAVGNDFLVQGISVALCLIVAVLILRK